MKIHTTNYLNTFIQVAEDSKARAGEMPPDKEPKSVARAQYEMLIHHPYKYTSDDVLYETQGKPKGLTREEYFSKGQACLRTSALGKRYGWGNHHDEAGKVALYGVESEEYKALSNDSGLKQLKAMRGSK